MTVNQQHPYLHKVTSSVSEPIKLTIFDHTRITVDPESIAQMINNP
jgi:hypothetical protein